MRGNDGARPTPAFRRGGVKLQDLVAVAAAAGWLVLFAVRARHRAGAWEFPLDDAYIYQQFARNLARGYWFQYQAGQGYTPGSTSILFPFLLVPGYLAGLSAQGMIGYTWLLEGVCLAVAAALAWRVADALEGPVAGWLALGLVLATGSFVAGVFSGMEIGLFTAMILGTAWLVIRDAQGLYRPGSPTSRRLWLLSALLGLGRPEGILVTASVTAAVLARDGRRSRRSAWFLWPAAALPFVLQGLYNVLEVGHFAPNTAQLKSVLAYPRQSFLHAFREILVHFGLFWKALLMTVNVPQLLPLGILTAGLALGWLGVRARLELRERRAFPALFLTATLLSGVAAGCVAVVPGNYYRYYHPTFALMSLLAAVALAAVWRHVWAGATGRQQRWSARAAVAVLLVVGVGQLEAWSGLVAKGCAEIRGQQHAMADWIATHTPPDAGILLNDVGAITYYTQRPIFDYLGLVTNHQAEVFLEGSGALFERLERIPVAERPAYLAVFPEWLRLPWIIGPELYRTEVSPPLVSVQYARASVYVADWSLLRSGEAPRQLPRGASLVDRLDVADLDSEHAHAYGIVVPPAARGLKFTTGLVRIPGPDGSIALDGGREILLKEHFTVCVPTAGDIGVTARIEADAPTTVSLRLNGRRPVSLEVSAAVRDVSVDLGTAAHRAECLEVTVAADPDRPYRVYHYWFWTLPAEQLP